MKKNLYVREAAEHLSAFTQPVLMARKGPRQQGAPQPISGGGEGPKAFRRPWVANQTLNWVGVGDIGLHPGEGGPPAVENATSLSRLRPEHSAPRPVKGDYA